MTATQRGTEVRRWALVVSALVAIAAPASASAGDAPKPTPVIFVHGNSGSAQQFETNAMRFTSNGYPHGRLFAYEYDTSGSSNDAAIAGLDGYIADVKSRTGAGQVDVLAHSRGTTVMHAYLNSSTERAAAVRRYVNFDGRTADSPPGGVATLAVWGEGSQTREIGGAQNLRFPNKAHTEVTTSRAAFREVYEFLNGSAPKTKNVLPEKPSKVKVAGRALIFPNNAGIDGGRLEIYRLNASTGQRKGGPEHSFDLGPDGSFGPVKLHGKRRYEFALTRPDADYTVHNYPEPFERGDRFYRVLDAPALRPFIDTGPNHTSVAVTRMREFWGDQSDPNFVDELSFNGVDVINPAIAPRARRVIAVFNFDEGLDQTTDLSEPLSPFSSISFLTGVDNYMPASPDASQTIAVRETMRGNRRHRVTTNVPNWPSEGHTVSVFFKDYPAKSYKPRKRR
jgi:pimeloyl-ACP methyl ester carboxylesterase